MYVVAPNMGTYYLFPRSPTPDRHVRRAVDDRRLQGPASSAGSATARGRPTSAASSTSRRCATTGPRAQWDNWMKDLRTEMYQIVYEQPIYPKNLYLDVAHEARGIPRQGHQAPDPAHARPWHLGKARALTHEGGKMQRQRYTSRVGELPKNRLVFHLTCSLCF